MFNDAVLYYDKETTHLDRGVNINKKVTIGDNCKIYGQVNLNYGTHIGKNVIIEKHPDHWIHTINIF